MERRDDDLEVARSMSDAVDALPMDDPLRAAIGLPSLDGDPLRDELRDVAVPDLEDRLLLLAGTTPSRRGAAGLWRTLAVAAAVLLVAGAWWVGRRSATTPSDETVAATDEPSPTPNPAQADVGPRLVAVKIWHETCPACKIIDPRYETVTSAFNSRDVLFVTLDMSTEVSRHQSALMAEVLGIGEVYRKHFGTSGFVLLVDPKTRAVVGKLTTEHDTGRMRQLLADAAGLTPDLDPSSRPRP